MFSPCVKLVTIMKIVIVLRLILKYKRTFTTRETFNSEIRCTTNSVSKKNI